MQIVERIILYLFMVQSLWVCSNYPYSENEHFSSHCFEDHLRLIFKLPHYVFQKYSSHITTNQEIRSIWNMLRKTDVFYLKYCRWLLFLFLVKKKKKPRSYPLNKCIVFKCASSMSQWWEVYTARVTNGPVLLMFCLTIHFAQ